MVNLEMIGSNHIYNLDNIDDFSSFGKFLINDVFLATKCMSLFLVSWLEQ